MEAHLTLNLFGATSDEQDEALFITGIVTKQTAKDGFCSKKQFFEEIYSCIYEELSSKAKEHWAVSQNHPVFEIAVHEISQLAFYHLISPYSHITFDVQQRFLKTQDDDVIIFHEFADYEHYLYLTDRVSETH